MMSDPSMQMPCHSGLVLRQSISDRWAILAFQLTSSGYRASSALPAVPRAQNATAWPQMYSARSSAGRRSFLARRLVSKSLPTSSARMEADDGAEGSLVEALDELKQLSRPAGARARRRISSHQALIMRWRRRSRHVRSQAIAPDNAAMPRNIEPKPISSFWVPLASVANFASVGAFGR